MADMSKIISLSVDDVFARDLTGLMEAAGYRNRSRFMRDAAVAFADLKRRGELDKMADDLVIEGHIVIYFQHHAESKLVDVRHSDELNITSYNHNCLSHSHTCVDVMHAIGTAANSNHHRPNPNPKASTKSPLWLLHNAKRVAVNSSEGGQRLKVLVLNGGHLLDLDCVLSFLVIHAKFVRIRGVEVQGFPRC